MEEERRQCEGMGDGEGKEMKGIGDGEDEKMVLHKSLYANTTY